MGTNENIYCKSRANRYQITDEVTSIVNINDNQITLL